METALPSPTAAPVLRLAAPVGTRPTPAGTYSTWPAGSRRGDFKRTKFAPKALTDLARTSSKSPSWESARRPSDRNAVHTPPRCETPTHTTSFDSTLPTVFQICRQSDHLLERIVEMPAGLGEFRKGFRQKLSGLIRFHNFI